MSRPISRFFFYASLSLVLFCLGSFKILSASQVILKGSSQNQTEDPLSKRTFVCEISDDSVKITQTWGPISTVKIEKVLVSGPFEEIGRKGLQGPFDNYPISFPQGLVYTVVFYDPASNSEIVLMDKTLDNLKINTNQYAQLLYSIYQHYCPTNIYQRYGTANVTLDPAPYRR